MGQTLTIIKKTMKKKNNAGLLKTSAATSVPKTKKTKKIKKAKGGK